MRDIIRQIGRAMLWWLSAAALSGAIADAPGTATPDRPSTADHAKFEELQGPFATGPEVTAACLQCHTEAAKQVRRSTHWTWEYTHPATGQKLGKRHVINSFCGTVASNEPRCTSCHVGYGWTDMRQDPPPKETQVDCLVCHDKTGTYQKLPTGAGHPNYQPIEWPKGSGRIRPAPDLGRIAQQVGATSRANCGACHFYGGGGDGVKHGDLDSSLVEPPRTLDVHMSPDGPDFSCAECHNPTGHQVPGSRYAVTARDTGGIDVPGRGDQSRASCESCHDTRPHAAEKLNDHTRKVACQTCHIPAFARGGVATKTWWDWSTAGRLDAQGKPLEIMGEHGHPAYSSQKGDFRYGENVVPEYRWFDGQVRYTLREDKLDDTRQPVPLNRVTGDYADPGSRIWPFKVMRGKQPYDTEFKTLLVSHVFGKDDTALWTNFDWRKALRAGTEFTGQPFSGKFGFVETEMYWPITHMVAPRENALSCAECHARDGRLAQINGFYLPGRDRNRVLDFGGWSLVLVILAGSLGHAALRIVKRNRRRPY